MLLLTITRFTSLVLIAKASPFEAQIRDGCNADDCLRELRHTSSLASPYCSAFYTSTSTVTTVTTVPALNATFPAQKNKREPTPAPELMKRATATTLPSFAQSCTEIATALSSGCSCLLGSNAATTTTTLTSTSTLPLPAQCSSQNSYGLHPTPLTFNAASLPNGQGTSGLAFEVYPGGCCAYCLASPNCIAYYEQLDYVATVPGKVGCSIEILGDEPIEPLGVPSCPLGTVTLTAGPVETSILYGNGACGTVVSTV